MSTTETQSEAQQLAGELDQRAALAVHPVVDALSTAAAAALRRLDAENKAMRAEVERYRWLREQHDSPYGTFGVVKPEMGDWTAIDEVAATGPVYNLDKAIDTIRAAQGDA